MTSLRITGRQAEAGEGVRLEDASVVVAGRIRDNRDPMPNAVFRVFDVNGFQFIMEKEFYEKAQPVKVDFLGYGFKIDSNIEFSAGDSACGSCSTSGHCSD